MCRQHLGLICLHEMHEHADPKGSQLRKSNLFCKWKLMYLKLTRAVLSLYWCQTGRPPCCRAAACSSTQHPIDQLSQVAQGRRDMYHQDFEFGCPGLNAMHDKLLQSLDGVPASCRSQPWINLERLTGVFLVSMIVEVIESKASCLYVKRSYS